jgi:hypothetical protein
MNLGITTNFGSPRVQTNNQNQKFSNKIPFGMKVKCNIEHARNIFTEAAGSGDNRSYINNCLTRLGEAIKSLNAGIDDIFIKEINGIFHGVNLKNPEFKKFLEEHLAKFGPQETSSTLEKTNNPSLDLVKKIIPDYDTIELPIRFIVKDPEAFGLNTMHYDGSHSRFSCPHEAAQKLGGYFSNQNEKLRNFRDNYNKVLTKSHEKAAEKKFAKLISGKTDFE